MECIRKAKSHPFNWQLEDNNTQRNQIKSSKFNHDYKTNQDTSLKGASIVETSHSLQQ